MDGERWRAVMFSHTEDELFTFCSTHLLRGGTMGYFPIWLGLITANFLYALLIDQNWHKALGWTWAQGSAILIVWFIKRWKKKT